MMAARLEFLYKEKEEASKADSDANSAYEQNKDMLGALDFTDNLSFLDTAFSYVSNTAPLSSFTLPDPSGVLHFQNFLQWYRLNY